MPFYALYETKQYYHIYTHKSVYHTILIYIHAGERMRPGHPPGVSLLAGTNPAEKDN